MTAVVEGTRTAKPQARKQRKPLLAVDPSAELLAYSHETGLGVLVIDCVGYSMGRIAADGKLLGMRLARDTGEIDDDGNRIIKRYEIDFATPHGWECNCDDATYRPGRPGGCKHVVALKKIAQRMRCERATSEDASRA